MSENYQIETQLGADQLQAIAANAKIPFSRTCSNSPSTSGSDLRGFTIQRLGGRQNGNSDTDPAHKDFARSEPSSWSNCLVQAQRSRLKVVYTGTQTVGPSDVQNAPGCASRAIWSSTALTNFVSLLSGKKACATATNSAITTFGGVWV